MIVSLTLAFNRRPRRSRARSDMVLACPASWRNAVGRRFGPGRRGRKLRRGLVVDGLLVALHALEHFAQGCDFAFELGDALDQRGGVELGLGGGVGGRKAEPDLVAAAPGHARTQGLVFLQNMQIERLRHRDVLGEDDTRAFDRQIAHQAAQRAVLVVEIDQAAQEAFPPSGLAPLAHCLPQKPKNPKAQAKVTSKSHENFTAAGVNTPLRMSFAAATERPTDAGHRRAAIAGATEKKKTALVLPGGKQAAQVIDGGAENAG